jgi:DNA-binding MarR family transcriptional regulator/KaiC/GvpD/RAD55 family RecA-like ATPase
MARDESRLDKRLFTVNERILLHLKESGSASHSIDLPAPMTQDGIASALGILVNHVSRAVKILQKQGCIREATARVKGEIRRRKIYLITEEGMAVANGIYNKIGETPVSVRDSRQRLREMPASEARRLLLPPRTYTMMLASLDERGVLDVHKAKTRKRRVAAVSRIVGAPDEAPFYGRVDELKKVRAWLQLRKPPVMAITGNKGIGKTVLSLGAVKSLEGRRPLLWLTLTPETTSDRIIEAISDFLRELGRIQFRVEESDDAEQLRKRLETCLIDIGALVVLDGVLDGQDDSEEAAKALFRAALATGNQVLIVARDVPSWVRELRGRRLLQEMQLQGLDKDSCRNLAPHLDEQEFAKAYRLARGNPLEIKLLSEYADETASGEGLTPEERALLRYLKVVHESDLR